MLVVPRVAVAGLVSAACWLALSLWAVPTPALAAQLNGVELRNGEYYIDVALHFDARPPYTETFRFDPDRYLITFSGCSLGINEEGKAMLSELSGSLLTRVSFWEGTDGLAVGFYLNSLQRPLIRYEERAYTIRFYTQVKEQRATQLGPGLTFTDKLVIQNGSNLQAYIVKAEPSARLKLYAAGADRYDGKTRKRAPSSFARRELADVVINGGFFGKGGEHLSTFVEDGVIRATGVYPSRPMLVIDPVGGCSIGRYNVASALLVDGQRIPISARNYPYESGKVIVYDYTYPLSSLPQNGMYYYLLEDGRLRYHDTGTAGLSLSPSAKLIATDIMPEANPLRQIAPDATVELETKITDALGADVLAQSVIGGAPLLIENGAAVDTIAEDKVQDDIAKSERSRTAVGLTKNGTLILLVVKEAESASYGGVTLKALTDLLLAEGAFTALNLDGGGSSAMVLAGQLLNLSEAEERPVSNVLVLKVAEEQASPTAPANGEAESELKYHRQVPMGGK